MNFTNQEEPIKEPELTPDEAETEEKEEEEDTE